MQQNNEESVITELNANSVPAEFTGDGFIALIDKEQDWTSFDVVAKLRSVTRIKKTGHAGTLDPFATGLLLILAGKATKTQEELSGSDKVYECVVKLGEKTDSLDRTGTVTARSDKQVTEEEIREAVMSFAGESLQMPPMFSAIKKDGKKLYKLARKGIEVEREPRKIIIYSISITDIVNDTVFITVHCSKGTYIRSLADDIGEKLGTYAHLKELRRIKIGSFCVKDAMKVDQFVKIWKENKA